MTLLILFLGLSKLKTFLLFCVTEEARRPWIWGGAGVSVGLLIVVCDQYFTDTPAVQVHVTSGVYTVAIKGGSTAQITPSLLPTKTKFYGRYNSDT